MQIKMNLKFVFREQNLKCHNQFVVCFSKLPLRDLPVDRPIGAIP